MTRHRLHNETWGFDSNCFVCEPKNTAGLRIPFDHDDEAGTVVADFTLPEDFSGAPSYVHGGVTLAILDEAQAWATIAVGGKFAVTAETTTRFVGPVRVGRPYRVEARITEQTNRLIRTAAEVRQADRAGVDGAVCASTTATFAVLSPATAKDAIGTELAGSDRDYVRE